MSTKKTQAKTCHYCGKVFVEGQTVLTVTDVKLKKEGLACCEKCYLLPANTGFRTVYVYQEMRKAMDANDTERLNELRELLKWVTAQNKLDRDAERKRLAAQ